jgi:polar amino acid transport system substrate-binding protein
MKKAFTVLASLLAVVALTSAALAADTLEQVKKKGVLVAGVKDSAPPFGFLDQKTGEIVGYEIDLMKVMA